MDRVIRILDADSNVLVEEPAKSNAKRYSVEAAADQRQIDALYRTGAVEARIVWVNGRTAHFRFVGGRSQFYFGQGD